MTCRALWCPKCQKFTHFEYRYKEEYGKVIPVCPRYGEPDPVMQCEACRFYSVKYEVCIVKRKKMFDREFACFESFYLAGHPVYDEVYVDSEAERLIRSGEITED